MKKILRKKNWLIALGLMMSFGAANTVMAADCALEKYNRTGWEAFVTNYTVEYLEKATAFLDGNLTTDWNCSSQNENPTKEKWIVVDMKVSQPISKIVLKQKTGTPGDYLRGFKVEVADEVIFDPPTPGYLATGPKAYADWVTVVAAGVGTPDSTVLDLTALNPKARYIKVTRVDVSVVNYWALAEFYVWYCPTPLCTAVPTDNAVTADEETICAGETATITLDASLTDVTYTLYLDGVKVDDSEQDGEDSEELTWIVDEAGTYTIKAIGDGTTYCDTEVTLDNDVTITVDAAPVGGDAEAVSSSIETDESATINLTDYIGSIQWQNSPNGVDEWEDLTGENTDELITEALTQAKSYFFRAEVTNSGVCDAAYSNVVEIEVTSGNVGISGTGCQISVIGYFDTLGRQLSKEPASGVYIIKYDNGTMKKVVK